MPARCPMRSWEELLATVSEGTLWAPPPRSGSKRSPISCEGSMNELSSTTSVLRARPPTLRLLIVEFQTQHYDSGGQGEAPVRRRRIERYRTPLGSLPGGVFVRQQSVGPRFGAKPVLHAFQPRPSHHRRASNYDRRSRRKRLCVELIEVGGGL